MTSATIARFAMHLMTPGNTRVLFVDDEKMRHTLFKQWFGGADHCLTVEQAIVLLKQRRYDVMSLDHDMGWGHKTGADLARHILENKIKADVIILHSYNNAGVRTMQSLLKEQAKQILCVPFAFNPEIYKALNNL